MGVLRSACDLRKWVLCVCLLLTIFSTQGFSQDTDEPSGEALPATPQVSAQSQTGAAAAAVAIALPPGRAGLAPALALTYGSLSKNGWLGVGFGLELASIERSTKWGLDFDAAEFTVTVNGSASELVARPEWGPGHYGAKIEGGFTKYRYQNDGGWEALSKDGSRLFFGASSESRQDDPADPRRVFRWRLCRVEDPNGNYFTVDYEKERGEIYPRRIRYTGHRSLPPLNEVLFHLEDRPDLLRRYAAGFEVVTARRLKTIEIRADGMPARAYGLTYALQGGRSHLTGLTLAGTDAAVSASGEITGGSRRMVFSAEYSPAVTGLSHRPVPIDPSLLQDGTLYAGDFDGDGRSDLFFHRMDSGLNRLFLSEPEGGYTRIDKPIDKGQIDAGGEDEGGSVYAADFDGDGKTDLFYHRPQSGVNRLFLSDGAGGFTKVAEPVKSGAVDGGEGNKGGRFFVGDFDGDGLADLFYRRSKSGYHLLFLNQGNGRFAAGVSLFGDKSLEEGALFAADFNADGRCDLLYLRRESGVNRLYLSQGGQTYTRHEAVFAQSLVNNDGRIQIGDFNADGLTDALYLNSGQVRLFTNQGRGVFSVQENAALGLLPPAELKGRLVTGEFNGDGLTDLFFFNPDTGKNRLYFARGDGGFTDHGPMLSGSTVIEAANKYPIAADVNGDGRAEVLFHRKASGLAALARSAEAPMPGLLVRLENALGGESRLSYTPSSQFENRNLPFVLPVLTAITTLDGLPDTPESRTQFAYEGGFYDTAEREFRGFEKLIARAPDGAVAISLYHQDQWLKGKSSRVEAYAAVGGALLSRTRFDWEAAPIGETGAGFVRLAGKETEVYDAETITSSETYVYDDTTGNLVMSTVAGSGAESLIKKILYANFGDWLIRPIKETLEGSVSGKVRESGFEYERGTGNLISFEHGLSGGESPRVTMGYDEYGNRVMVKDPLGHVTRTVYDEKSRSFPVKVILPKSGHVRKSEYDYRLGKAMALVDENRNITRHAYDAFGRRIHTLTPDGGESFVIYNDEEFPASVITRVRENDQGDFIEKIRYVDGLGRVIQAVAFGEEKKPVVTRAFYDAMGRNHASYGPFFAQGPEFPQSIPDRCPFSKTSFDNRSRPIAIEKPDSAHGTITASFSYRGLSSTVTDPDGGAKTETRDYLGRVIAVVEHTDSGDALTSYAYNAAGDLLSVTNSLGRTISMAYDSLGRKSGMEDPDMGRWSYSYDAAGRLISQTDAKNQRTSFEYDALGRILKKTYSTGDPAVTYTYDPPGVANGIGRLHQVKNATATTTYKAYDPMGRVLETSRSVKGAPRSSYTSLYRYDPAGRLASIQYPDNYHLTYDYHPGTGLLRSVIGITDFTPYAKFSAYDALGRPTAIIHADGSLTRHEFDPLSNRLSELSTRNAQNAALQQKSYHYSRAGDILSITDESGLKQGFQYDRQHRLLDDTRMVPSFDDTFPLHGPKRVTIAGAAHPITYDANGNMISLPDLSNPQRVRERLIDYNAENMPIRIRYAGEDAPPPPPGGGGSARSSASGSCFIGSARAASLPAATVALEYDGEGRRAIKTTHGSRKTFYVAAHFEVNEGVEIKYIFAAGRRIAKVSANSAFLLHADHLGSATVVTDLETGETLETTAYHPYGLIRTQTGFTVTRHRFTGQEHDAETGLYNYNARLYDPALGVFITPDALVQDPYDPQTLNRYAYARNNPLSYTDPSGHVFVVDDLLIGVAVGAAFGAAMGGGFAAITGGDIGKGILTGAISGALFGAVGGYVSGVNAAATAAFEAGTEAATIGLAGETFLHAYAGAVAGGINAGITGGDIGIGALTGGISAGVANYAGGSLPNNILLQLFSRTTIGGLSGGIASSLYGRPFGQGFVYGAGSAAFGYICNHLKGISIMRFRAYIQASVKGDDLLFDIFTDLFDISTSRAGILFYDILNPRDAGVPDENALILEWEMKNCPERYTEIGKMIESLKWDAFKPSDPLQLLRYNSRQIYFQQGR